MRRPYNPNNSPKPGQKGFQAGHHNRSANYAGSRPTKSPEHTTADSKENSSAKDTGAPNKENKRKKAQRFKNEYTGRVKRYLRGRKSKGRSPMRRTR